MIYTLTLNPSIDYVVKINNFNLGTVNRTQEETVYPGGKGINVSLVLNALGIKNIALGFIAGFTGLEIEQRLQKLNIQTDFIRLREGFSRINTKINSTVETELNGSGPQISQDEIQELFKKLDMLQEGDIIVLAGNIPQSLPKNLYSQIMNNFSAKDISFVVDTTGKTLIDSLKYKPFLIKPNHHELGELFNRPLTTKEQVIPYAKELQKMGAKNVLVSMAEKGAILVTEDNQIYEETAPACSLVNSVGAGDSMVAGFIAGFFKTGSYKKALHTGILCGTASAASEWLLTKEKAKEVLPE